MDVLLVTREFGERVDILLRGLDRPELVAEARRLVGPALLVGASTHDPSEVAALAAQGADYGGLGPCFATTTKRLDRARGSVTRSPRSLHPGTDSTGSSIKRASRSTPKSSSAACGRPQESRRLEARRTTLFYTLIEPAKASRRRASRLRRRRDMTRDR
jgi:hypothetical protein